MREFETWEDYETYYAFRMTPEDQEEYMSNQHVPEYETHEPHRFDDGSVVPEGR